MVSTRFKTDGISIQDEAKALAQELKTILDNDEPLLTQFKLDVLRPLLKYLELIAADALPATEDHLLDADYVLENITNLDFLFLAKILYLVNSNGDLKSIMGPRALAHGLKFIGGIVNLYNVMSLLMALDSLEIRGALKHSLLAFYFGMFYELAEYAAVKANNFKIALTQLMADPIYPLLSRSSVFQEVFKRSGVKREIETYVASSFAGKTISEGVVIFLKARIKSISSHIFTLFSSLALNWMHANKNSADNENKGKATPEQPAAALPLPPAQPMHLIKLPVAPEGEKKHSVNPDLTQVQNFVTKFNEYLSAIPKERRGFREISYFYVTDMQAELAALNLSKENIRHIVATLLILLIKHRDDLPLPARENFATFLSLFNFKLDFRLQISQGKIHDELFFHSQVEALCRGIVATVSEQPTPAFATLQPGY